MKVLLFSLLALTVSCSGPQSDSGTSSSLSGVYDDQYLLRLAEAPSSDKESSTYQFETCNPSGDLCTGAFRNAEGTDVLFELKMMDDLALERNDVEYNLLRNNIEKHINEMYQDSNKKVDTATERSVFVGPAVATGLFLTVGAFGTSNPYRAISMALIGWVSLGTGIVVFNNQLKAVESAYSYGDARQDVKDSEEVLPALPKYMDMKNGILSTDPDNHVQTDTSVASMTHVLARHINQTVRQQTGYSDAQVVESVCFINTEHSELQFCEKLSIP